MNECDGSREFTIPGGYSVVEIDGQLVQENDNILLINDEGELIYFPNIANW